MAKPIRIIVLSAGDGGGINFCKSLKLIANKYFIIGTDTNIYRLCYATADERYLLPDPEAPEYWPTLLKLVARCRPDFIYAADTNKELTWLSEKRDEVGIPYFLPCRESVRIYEDKWLSYQHFKTAGLSVPLTILIERPDDIDEAMRLFGQIWLRSTYGSGGRGSIPTGDPILAKAWIERHRGWGRFTAAEILSTRMATWSGLWLNGTLAVCQARRRLFWEYANLSPSGVTGITGAQSTTGDSKIHEVALASIAAIPHSPNGIVSVDLTYDSNGKPNPTEIQSCRFYSSILFLSTAGLNLPDMYVTMGLSGALPDLPQRMHPLPEDLLWLKAVDCLPMLTNMTELSDKNSLYSI